MRITDAKDLGQLNKAFREIENLKKLVGNLREALGAVKHQVAKIDVKHAPATSNNLTFNWTGGTTKLDWLAGSVQDKHDINIPVSAGNLTLLASTHYWLAWNNEHNQMVADKNVQNLFKNPSNHVICRVFTGAGGDTGVAGGGGSQATKDLSGQMYKLF